MVGVAADDGAEPADEAAADDGSEKWTFDESELELEDEADPHLNGIAKTGDGSLFIVAERGSAFRSTDEGQTWQRLKLPYDGSMFGVIGYENRHVLAFGLRGNVFEYWGSMSSSSRACGLLPLPVTASTARNRPIGTPL